MLICSSACISDLGQAIFYTTTCLLPFLSDDILSTLPYTMISTLATFPPFLHKDIIEYLSTSFLPMAICEYTNCVCVNMRDVYSKQHLSKYFSNHLCFQENTWLVWLSASTNKCNTMWQSCTTKLRKLFMYCSGFDSKRGWRSSICQSVRLLHADDRHAVHFKSRYIRIYQAARKLLV